MPKLVAASSSPPSIPAEACHASCNRIVQPFYVCDAFFEKIKSAINYAWSNVHHGVYVYGSENDITIMVRSLLSSICEALGIEVRICTEMGIMGIRPDILILTMGFLLIGVIEVKKPGQYILSNANVLGELFDQIKLIRMFYGMGPALGILATGEEYLVAWYPCDDTFFANPLPEIDNSFSTPLRMNKSKDDDSPPGTTPSSQRMHAHGIEADISDPLHGQADVDDRLLSSTDIHKWKDNIPFFLNLLSTALMRMTLARVGYYESTSSSFIRFHKDTEVMTWRTIKNVEEECRKKINFEKYPRSDVTTLLAVEDLGRGSNGKAWLVTTETFSSVCVLKFDNKDNKENLIREQGCWHLIYPEYKHMVRVEKWSGVYALVMPHFSTIPQNQRNLFGDKIVSLLNRIHKIRYKHNDVRWRNIGCITTRDGTVPVLYDLIHLQPSLDDSWISESMSQLFGSRSFSLPIPRFSELLMDQDVVTETLSSLLI